MPTLQSNLDHYRKVALKQPSGFLQGIYFDMPNDVYHADPAFSHSGMVDILKHQYFYWVSSPLNPQREQRSQTDSMRLGQLIHEKLLDPKRFNEEYRAATSSYAAGKKILSSETMKNIDRAIAELGDTKDLYFRDGFPEVAVFWIDPETGMRLKAKYDWMKTFGAVDRKNCKEITDSEIGQAIANYGYDIQEELYVQGMKCIKEALRKGSAVVRGCPDENWLKRFVAEPTCGFGFLFQRTQWPFVFRYLQLESDVIENAKRCIDEAKQAYLDGLDWWGLGPWPAGDGVIRKLPSTAIPMRIYNRSYNG